MSTYQVSQQKVDDLLADIEKNIPDAEISYKDEGAPSLFVAFLFFLVSFIGKIGSFLEKFPTKLSTPFHLLGNELSNFDRVFFTRVSNGIGGKYIIFPSRETHGNLRDYHVYSILRHEYVHLLDQKRRPFIFNLTYVLLPLPFILSGRAHWELRGYAQNMIVRHEEFGRIPDQMIESISRQFWKPLYVWMFPFKKKVRSKITRLKDLIEKGEIEGFNPDIKFFGDIHK